MVGSKEVEGFVNFVTWIIYVKVNICNYTLHTATECKRVNILCFSHDSCYNNGRAPVLVSMSISVSRQG